MADVTDSTEGSMASLRSIGQEMKTNPPAILNSTKRKFGAQRADKQRVAILLSKARRAGVKVPSYSPNSKSMKGV